MQIGHRSDADASTARRVSTMMRKLSLLALVLFSQATPAQDAVHTDGDKYRVLLENEHVRVLAFSDRPGDKTHQHRHPAFVVYALAPFKRKLVLADGRTLTREFKAGDVLYSDGETHIGENIGATPTQVIMIEVKPTPNGADFRR
jgi:quercetin dioxygenase-like cupin family protein